MDKRSNYSDDEKEKMLAVPFHTAPPLAPSEPHQQQALSVCSVGNMVQQFPISNSQSSLLPSMEPFYPSLHGYMQPNAVPSNVTVQTCPSAHFSPSTTSLDMHLQGVPFATMNDNKIPTHQRIFELEKQLKEAVKELTFFGDRNWRMEAYIDCLVHTLRKMDVTSVIDLNQKMLPLSLFHVKAKAGFQLGSFNQLPRRTIWSYNKEGLRPPNIDLSGSHVGTREPINKTRLLKSLEEENLIPEEGDDIGLSADQLFKYESKVIELEKDTCNLKERLQIASEKENILMERLRTSQQANNILEEEINTKSEELKKAQNYISRLEQQNFRRFPRNPHFQGRFRPRMRFPFHRPPFPYPPPPHPPHSPHPVNMPFGPPPPFFAGPPPLPPPVENDISTQMQTFNGVPHGEAPPILTLPPDLPQPVYFIAPPFPPPPLPAPLASQLPPASLEELEPNVPSNTDIQTLPKSIAPSNTNVTFVPVAANV